MSGTCRVVEKYRNISQVLRKCWFCMILSISLALNIRGHRSLHRRSSNCGQVAHKDDMAHWNFRDIRNMAAVGWRWWISWCPSLDPELNAREASRLPWTFWWRKVDTPQQEDPAEQQQQPSTTMDFSQKRGAIICYAHVVCHFFSSWWRFSVLPCTVGQASIYTYVYIYIYKICI